MKQKMTVAEVASRVEEIDLHARRNDHEVAHAEEDCLHRDVLHAIALGAENSDLLARAALMTTKLNFHRWRS